jgi:hypothetical protein
MQNPCDGSSPTHGG